MVVGCRWSSRSLPGSPGTLRRCPGCSPNCGWPDQGPAGHAAARCAARGQGLLLTRAPRAPALAGHHRGHPRARRPDRQPRPPRLERWPPGRLRRRRLPQPQRHRAGLQPAQELARHRDPIQQARLGLSRRSGPGLDPALALMTYETRPRWQFGKRDLAGGGSVVGASSVQDMIV